MALFGIFGELKRTSEALWTIAREVSRGRRVLEEMLERTQDGGTVSDRMKALELKQSMWEATVEAELAKADTKYKSARNAEERERTMKRSHGSDESGLEGEEEMREAYEALGLLPKGDVEAGNGEGLPELHGVVEGEPRSARALVKAYKFGA